VRNEDRAFAPRGDDDLKADLLAFLDEELHQPLLAAEPHPLSEEHRRRLVNAQEAVHAEIELLQACATAEEVALTLLGRIEAGALDDLDADARFLGFRSIEDLGRELAERAQAVGIDCQAPSARPRADHSGLGEAKRQAQTVQERQDLLLDEGIGETFPASDPVSVSTPKIDDTSA
jgi:hypothetical protein